MCYKLASTYCIISTIKLYVQIRQTKQDNHFMHNMQEGQFVYSSSQKNITICLFTALDKSVQAVSKYLIQGLVIGT